MSNFRQDNLRGVEGYKEERRVGALLEMEIEQGQLKHFTVSLFGSPAQHSEIIYTAHYGVMNLNKLNSSIITTESQQ